MKIKKPSAKYLSIPLVFLALLSSSCSNYSPINGAQPSYEAFLICLNHDLPVHITDCLQEGGSIKLEEGSDTKIYQNADYGQLGWESPDKGLHVRLPEHFRLTAQNTGNDVILSAVLDDSKGHAVYVDHEKTQGIIDISR